jgi:hypothetical protein
MPRIHPRRATAVALPMPDEKTAAPLIHVGLGLTV